ncbi:MAG: HTH domain-containing protein [Bulleidia sp.]|nr:HTH domain-containing protein [Bulleidia sp.]
MILPDLNYDVPQDVPQDEFDVMIRKLIRENNKTSTDKMAERLKVSSKTIKRRIKLMKDVSYVVRGSNGYWKIDE